MDYISNLFGIPVEVIRKLVVMIHKGQIVPISEPHTTNPEILKRVNFVNDYYNHLLTR